MLQKPMLYIPWATVASILTVLHFVQHGGVHVESQHTQIFAGLSHGGRASGTGDTVHAEQAYQVIVGLQGRDHVVGGSGGVSGVVNLHDLDARGVFGATGLKALNTAFAVLGAHGIEDGNLTLPSAQGYRYSAAMRPASELPVDR